MYFNVYGHVDLQRAVCAIGYRPFLLFFSLFSAILLCFMFWVYLLDLSYFLSVFSILFPQSPALSGNLSVNFPDLKLILIFKMMTKSIK